MEKKNRIKNSLAAYLGDLFKGHAAFPAAAGGSRS